MGTIFEDTKSIFYTRIVLVMVGLISSVIIARTLGPSGKGQLYLLLTLPTLIVSWVNLGVGQANTYFVASKKFSLNELLSGSIVIALATGFAGIVIGLCIYRLLEDAFVDIRSHLLVFALLTIPFSLLNGYCSYIFLGMREIRLRNRLVSFAPILYTSTVFVLFIIGSLTIENIVLAYLFTSFLPVVWILHHFRFNNQFRWNFDFYFIPRSIKFGFIPFLTLLIMGLNYKADIYIIKYFQPSEQLGIYSISVSWAEKLWWIPQALGMVIFSRVPGMADDLATRLTSQLSRIALTMSLSIALFYAVLSIYIIPVLYGRDFGGAVVPFLLLLPGIVSMVIYKVLHPDFTARNKAAYSLSAFAIALLVNIILNIILIPRFGINGAAIASTISYSLGTYILLLAFSKINKISITDILLVKKADILLVRNKLKKLAG